VFALVSLVPVVVLGVVLASLLRRQADNVGLKEGNAQALLVARSSIAPLLGGHDLRQGLRPTEAAALRRSVNLIVRDRQVLRLRLRDLRGQVIFADDNSGLGTADDEALAAAHGHSTVDLTWLNADLKGASSLGPRVVEAYVPLDSAQNGDRIGVLEVYLPYQPIEAAIASQQRVVMAALSAGLFFLWLAMLGVSWSVTRTLRRQGQANAFLAQHDPLTGLANRSQFAERAQQAVAVVTAERQAAVALVDLDRFKEVNDTLGHGNGDALLVRLADRLLDSMRDGDLVARLGGDEFGIILNGLRRPEEAAEILGRLRAVLGESVMLGDLPLAVEASIGFVLTPDDGQDVENLVARADLAMYVAKRERRGVVRYEPSHDRYDSANLTLAAELGDAITNGELRLHFQPKADLRDGRVRAVEALVRWQHPTRGLLYPDAFLPAAEQTELVEPLTQWVLRHAIESLPLLDPDDRLEMAVNISARSLVRPEFASDILAVIDSTGIAAHRVILEITETALLVDPDRAAASLTVLAERGVRVSIDDFGAGQTSLGYLARLPISELKIDKAFVLAMCDDPRNAAIVRSIIDLGHSLGFSVTAEGMETTQALDLLTAAGCDRVQGYLLARPMPADAYQRQTWTLPVPAVGVLLHT
jgi:diguanylate cyclase